MTKAIFARRLHPVPVSLERLEPDANGEVISTFTRAGSDGTMGIKLSPLERLEKLAALIPPPRVHQVQYGLFGPTHEASSVVLRASSKLQDRFVALLEKRKTRTLSPQEAREYDSICDLDKTLIHRPPAKPEVDELLDNRMFQYLDPTRFTAIA